MVLIKIRLIFVILVAICFVGSSLEWMNPQALRLPRGGLHKMSITTTEAPTSERIEKQDMIKVKVPPGGLEQHKIKLTKSDKEELCKYVKELENIWIKSIPRFG